MKREATLSADGKYRYDLTRTVEPDCKCSRCSKAHPEGIRSGFVLWALCNPSKASAEVDDATERRCWGYTSKWGYRQMILVNTNPYRSTSPCGIPLPDHQAQLLNSTTITSHAKKASLIICAWGGNAREDFRKTTENLLRSESKNGSRYVLKLSATGIPMHPLYLSGGLVPQLWK